ncbi:MAG: disulfide bond formation protein B [Candidatus Paracaedibacteraceae bacterium]|nr:disulfide bond formation protein B [Candidatus Paracaedibacteraceae bacterium]
MTMPTCSKKILNCLITEPRGIAFFILNIALSALLFVLVAEYFWQIKPCILCMYQRYVMFSLVGVAFFGFLVNSRLFSWMYVLIISIGLSIAGYHVGVEQHWWKGPDACSAEAPKVDVKASQADQIKTFREKLKQKSVAVVRCDEVNWRIFGISATFLTFVLYAGMLGFLSIGLLRKKK